MREMLRATACAAAVGWLAVTASPARAHPPAIVSGPAEKALAVEVADFRKRLARVLASKDVAALRALYADSYRHTHANGRIDGKDARIALLQSGVPVIESAPVEELVISVPNGWAAVATGRSRLGEREVRWTITYVRAGDGWQVAAAQETLITAAR